MTALVLVAPGSEEIETVAIVDTLVRGGIEVVLASCGPTGARQICASRGVQIVADCHLDELTTCDFELIVVPGGLPGSEVIRDTPLAIDLLREQAALGRWRAAICAAPAVVLLHHDLLGDASATCHPGFQARLPGGQPARAFVWMQGHTYTNMTDPRILPMVLRGIAWAGKKPVNELVDYKPPAPPARAG